MAGDSRARELGDLLELLKVRSDRSYESIARKIHVSKSTVHRYCTGASVPQQFGILERVGQACGASPEELVRLHRLWVRAAHENTTDDPGERSTGGTQPPPAQSSGPVRTGARRRGRRLAAGIAMAVCLIAVLAGGGASGRDGAPAPSASPQPVLGPAWIRPPTPVPSAFFGVTINSSTGAMPTFRVGAVRLWDSGTRWSEIQPRSGEFDWSVLDRLVAGAERQGLPILFVFGGTPHWASPAGPAGTYPDATPAPPDRLADWDAYVEAVATRYRGRIESYELWVLGNDPRMYSGDVETLVEMTRRAADIIRATDPTATLGCPGMGRLWEPDAMRFLENFARLGGYDHCDVAGIKLFQRSAADPPETMLELTAAVDRAMHAAGVHPRLWNTGTTYTIPLQDKLEAGTARDYAVRFFLVGLYARDVNLERTYFYNWGGTKIPVVLQAVGGPPTSTALAVERLQRWLTGARIRSCGHGTAVGLPVNMWTCQFTVGSGEATRDAAILWTDTGVANTTARPGAMAVHNLDGEASPVRSGDDISVTGTPILVEFQPPARP